MHRAHLPTPQDYEEGCWLPCQPANDYPHLSIKNTLLLTKNFFFFFFMGGGQESSPQSQKHHSTIKLEAEQEEGTVLFVNYQSLEQSQPANR